MSALMARTAPPGPSSSLSSGARRTPAPPWPRLREAAQLGVLLASEAPDLGPGPRLLTGRHLRGAGVAWESENRFFTEGAIQCGYSMKYRALHDWMLLIPCLLLICSYRAWSMVHGAWCMAHSMVNYKGHVRYQCHLFPTSSLIVLPLSFPPHQPPSHRPTGTTILSTPSRINSTRRRLSPRPSLRAWPPYRV